MYVVMKKTLMLFACLTIAVNAFAQIEAYTTWPYQYFDFQKGTLTLSNGQQRFMPVNIHLLKGDLHYITDEGIIQTIPSAQYFTIQIGEDLFGHVSGYLMQIYPGPDKKNYVAVRRTADLAALNETGGAYGVSSTTSSTQRLTSIDMPGMVNSNHMEQMQHRDSGKRLTIKTEYYVVIDGDVVKATKKDVMEAIGPEKKAAFKAFLKKNKINWKNEQSLLKIFDFFN